MAHKYNPFAFDAADDAIPDDGNDEDPYGLSDRASLDDDHDSSGDPRDRDDSSTGDEEDDEEDASSDDTATSSDKADSTTSDEDYVAHYRDRRVGGLLKSRITTQAREAGFKDADDLRFQATLRRQHELRVPDRTFGQMREDTPGHLSARRWTAWRTGFLEHFGLTSRTKLEEVTIKVQKAAEVDHGRKVSGAVPARLRPNDHIPSIKGTP